MVQGDKDAFAELIRRYHPRVYQLCLGMLGAPDRADEAAQEVFIKAYRFLRSFRGDSLFSTWLYRLTSNHCLDILRANTRRKAESLDSLLELNPSKIEALISQKDESDLPADERMETIEKVLQTLSPDVRLILTLREMQGFTYREIADTLHVTVDSVKSKLKRSRAELREKVRHLLKRRTSNT